MDDAALIELVVRSRACEVHGLQGEWLEECPDCAAGLKLARMVQAAVERRDA